MADALPLPPDASDLPISVTIDKAARPYVTEWFIDEKRTGETPDQFLLRMMYNVALQHRRDKLAAIIPTEYDVAEKTELDQLQQDFSDLQAAIENLL